MVAHRTRLPRICRTLKTAKLQYFAGPRADEFVEAVDVFPTLADLAGLSVPQVCPPNPFKVIDSKH